MPIPPQRNLARILGIALIPFFWLVAIISISQNTWFIFDVHAFSHLGAPDATSPWLYNYGLIICGALAVLYSIFITLDSENKFETTGGAFLFVAGVFLALIGVFHSGVPEHGFVTAWFFIQIDIAILAWGVGRGWRRYGIVVLAMGTLGPLFACVIDWPSAALVDAYGIVLINAWLVLMQRVHAAVLPASQR